MAQDLRRIINRNFYLGYNDRDKPETLMSDEYLYMAMIRNAFINEGKIEQRDGYTQIGDNPVAKMILGQDRHEPYGGSKYILRAIDNVGSTNSEVQGWSGVGNFTALTGATTQTAGALHEFITANSATYIFNGVDPVLKTTNGTSTSVIATIPEGVDAEWFHNYFFVFGVAGFEDRLYFSNIGDPEIYDPADYLDINPGDNEPIIALAVLKDELLIFKQSRIWSLTGFGTTDFTLDDIGERGTNIGTVARRSVVSIGNDVYFLSYRGATPHFRSIRKTEDGQIVDGGIVSDVIANTMKTLNRSQLHKCAGEFDGRRIWWGVADGTSTENNLVLVLDTITGGWTQHTGINPSVFHISTITGETDLFFGSAEEDGKSHQMGDGVDDDGDPVEFEVWTPYYNPEPGHKTRYKYMYITGDSDIDAQLDIDYSIDGFTAEDLATVDMTGLGAIFGSAIFGVSAFGQTTIVKHRLDWAGGPAYFMQYRFYHAELDKKIILRGWEIFHQTKPLRAA